MVCQYSSTQLAATNEHIARFCLLEQHLPQGANHPFAKTMLAHFNKLHSPIHAVHQYPLLSQQSSRFTDAGWSTIDICRNLWDLWSDKDFTPPLLRRSLDTVEPFDEWEEFSLYAGHYFLLVASNTKSERPADTATAENSTPDARDMNNFNALTIHGPSTDFPLTLRRFGAAFSMGQDGNVAFHGGQGLNQRLKSMDVLRRKDSTPDVEPIEPSSVPQARVCHTITSISNTQALLVGGRASPLQAMVDCWINKSGEWQLAEELTPARFRHSSTKVKIPLKDSEIEGVLVFGGKTSDGKVLGDWCMWTLDEGWRIIPVVGPRPPARFGAAISTMGVTRQSWGLLCGGMDDSGTVFDDIWDWKIDAASAGDLQLTFVDRTNDTQQTTAHGRIGASLLPFGQSLLLIGGVSKKEILPLAENFLAIFNGCGTPLQIAKANITIPDSAYPLLVGFSGAAISADEIVIAGGGAVCFAMGSFWNEELFSIRSSDLPEPQPWSVAICHPDLTAQVQPPRKAALINDKGKGKGKNRVKDKNKAENRNAVRPTITIIPRLRIKSSNDFDQIFASSKPVTLEGLDIGPCTSLWTLDYLKEKIGPDRILVVHECSNDQMTFKSENLQYVEKSVGEFLDSMMAGSKTSLCAVSTSQSNQLPTKLEEDFPTIAAEFQLPDSLASIKENHHSSPLEISGPASLWLHYDVLANLICQVRGTRTLHLYPPSDAKHLEFPAGRSSSSINVTSTNPKLRYTHPHIASLVPGDILFIPPMWAHAAMPSDDISVAVNVFWKSLSDGHSRDTDVYGNRDLQAYETGRMDVEKILKAFEHLPADLSRSYLDRLVGELQDKADKIGEK
jgi:tRNA wybutosine-synthesizing protein 4